MGYPNISKGTRGGRRTCAMLGGTLAAATVISLGVGGTVDGECLLQVPEHADVVDDQPGAGEMPHDEKQDAADVAALAMVVKMLLSFDECVSKR